MNYLETSEWIHALHSCDEDREIRDQYFYEIRQLDRLLYYPPYTFPKAKLDFGRGFYAVVNYDDIELVSRNPKLFSSASGTNIPDLPLDVSRFFGSMINMDDPEHFKMRAIVSKAFTPKSISITDEKIRLKVQDIIRQMIDNNPSGQCDFVHHFSSRVPMEFVCDMMDIPQKDISDLHNFTNRMSGQMDPDYKMTFDNIVETAYEVFDYAKSIAEFKLKNPGEDLTSAILHAEVDGDRISLDDFCSFFLLLVMAGGETTKNVISNGLKFLTDHQEQKDLWFNNFEELSKSAIEELARYSTPVIHFRRTVTEDCVLKNTELKKGDKVVMYYLSGNMDEKYFDDPFSFNLKRDFKNRQLSYGAGGPHFCLGANLARREIYHSFNELRKHLPNIHSIEPPSYLRSEWVNGVKSLRCSW